MTQQQTLPAVGLGWPGIIRLGVVQAMLGGIVALTTSTLNRVMVVEVGLVATIPAALVAWHYAVQLSRPYWGHQSDRGGRRTPWILGGMAVLATGAVFAADATALFASNMIGAILLGVLAFTLIGAGVGLAGTTLLALLASEVTPARRPAAAAITWIMMIVGIVLTSVITGILIEPYSPARLNLVVLGVSTAAVAISWLALFRLETGRRLNPADTSRPAHDFKAVMRETWADPVTRFFSIFVFVSMLAYSAQDLILEPFAGLLFDYSVGASSKLAGVQHGGVLLGMVAVGLAGSVGGGHSVRGMRAWTFAGCAGSALALAGLALAAASGPASGWPLQANVFALGLFNGVFAVSAIGAMMGLAGAGGGGREGTRMGLWGAAQAMAFGIGGFAGAACLDVFRHTLGPAGPATDGQAFMLVFAGEATLFVISAVMALWIGGATRTAIPALPNSFAADLSPQLPSGLTTASSQQ
jgi:MFS transporter, BCD family, chlorophyll transporter